MVQLASYLRRVLWKTRVIFPRINGPIEYFSFSYWRRDLHVTSIAEPRKGLAVCRAKRVPLFLSHFKTLSIGPALGIELTATGHFPPVPSPHIFESFSALQTSINRKPNKRASNVRFLVLWAINQNKHASLRSLIISRSQIGDLATVAKWLGGEVTVERTHDLLLC